MRSEDVPQPLVPFDPYLCELDYQLDAQNSAREKRNYARQAIAELQREAAVLEQKYGIALERSLLDYLASLRQAVIPLTLIENVVALRVGVGYLLREIEARKNGVRTTW